MAEERVIIDLSDRAAKQLLLVDIGRRQGWHEIRIKKRYRVRTNPQNRAYWGMVVPALQQALTESQGQPHTDEQAHAILKARFLAVDTRIVNDLGMVERVRYVRSSATLDVQEFSEYFDLCRDWLSEFWGIVIPDPGEYE